MATTYNDQYPTPPPTGSPKQYSQSQSQAQAQGPSSSTQHQYQNQQRPYSPPRRPAQESYFDTSLPVSPTQIPAQAQPQQRWDASGKTPFPRLQSPQRQENQTLPPRRRSSPINPSSQKPYPSSEYSLPPRRRSSPGTYPRKSPTVPPRPLHFSPVNPIPTPFNASRPLPRPGLISRLLSKLKTWFKSFLKWSRSNPIKAGLLTFIPVLAGAGLTRMFSGVSKLVSGAGIAIMEGMGGGKTPGNWDGKKKEMEKEVELKWGYGLDEFKGFAGAKGGGPVGGFLKVIQMLANHYCKLSPSAIPRVTSILLELYFLEKAKL